MSNKRFADIALAIVVLLAGGIMSGCSQDYDDTEYLENSADGLTYSVENYEGIPFYINVNGAKVLNPKFQRIYFWCKMEEMEVQKDGNDYLCMWFVNDSPDCDREKCSYIPYPLTPILLVGYTYYVTLITKVDAGVKSLTVPLPCPSEFDGFKGGDGVCKTITEYSYLAGGALDECTELQELRISNKIGENAVSSVEGLLRNCAALTDIYLEFNIKHYIESIEDKWAKTIPEDVDWRTVEELKVPFIVEDMKADYQKVTLHVVKGCAEVWKEVPGWDKFVNVVEDIEPTYWENGLINPFLYYNWQ